MWTCSKCGERIEDDFEVCWSCGTSVDGVPDPNFFSTDTTQSGPETPPGVVPEHLVIVTSCSLPAQALAMRMRLEAAGIPVFLVDEYTVSMDWLLSNAIGGIKVQVAEADIPRACEVLGIELPDAEDEDDADSAKEDDEAAEDEDETPDDAEVDDAERDEAEDD